jgi:glycosyltransferase involved in cell wall biosynthesis
MRVVHASFHRDPQQRPADELLRAWPTLFDVAHAAQSENISITIVQAHHIPGRTQVNGIDVVLTTDVIDAVTLLEPDLVHVHGLHFARDTRRLCAALSVPVLVQDHGGGRPGRIRRPFLRWGLTQVSAAAFTAAEQAESYATMLPRAIKVFEVLESSTRFTPGPQEPARTATFLHGDPCLLWVGRLDRNKDPITTLNAVRLVAARLPSVQLFCCYTATDLLPLVRSTIERDVVLRSRVRLLGKVDHERVQQLCRAADFFVSSSHSEGSGYALLESLACGLTPVVTDIPSFRAITGRGAVGELYPVADARAMADAIVRLSKLPRAELRERAIAHFRSHLTFDVIGEQLRSAYTALVG